MKHGYLKNRDIGALLNTPGAASSPKPAFSSATDTAFLGISPFPYDEEAVNDADVRESISEAAYIEAGRPRSLMRMCRKPDCERVLFGWILYEDLNPDFSEYTGWTIPETPLPRPYVISPIQGKGRGMFASRTIKAGELIVRERPVLIFPQANIDTGGWEAFERKLKQLTACLEPADRVRLLDLYNCKTADECGPIAGIARTNAIECYFPQARFSKAYGAVCLDISRCNHSCAPNATYSFNNKTFLTELRATHNIALGEEITITYTGLTDSRVIRSKGLQKKYCFNCACRICLGTPEEIKESDHRRKFISMTYLSLLPMWHLWFTGSRGKMGETGRLIDAMNMLLKAAETEGIYKSRRYAVTWLACTYGALGDEENFTKWAQEVVEATEIKGTLARENEKWKGWLCEPATMMYWGMRRGVAV